MQQGEVLFEIEPHLKEHFYALYTVVLSALQSIGRDKTEVSHLFQFSVTFASSCVMYDYLALLLSMLLCKEMHENFGDRLKSSLSFSDEPFSTRSPINNKCHYTPSYPLYPQQHRNNL